MRFASPFLCALAAAAVLAFAGTSRAQVTGAPSVTGIAGSVLRLEPSGTSAESSHPHPGAVPVNSLNFEDCSADLRYQFTLLISSINSSYSLQAWAGATDCTPLTARQTDSTATCWPLLPSGISQQNPVLVTIRMADIVSQVASTAHHIAYTPASAETACQSVTGNGPTTITIYFFFVDAQGNAVGNAQPYPVTVDLRAAAINGTPTAGVGDGLLIVSIPPGTDTDTKGYNVYCDPPPGQEGTSTTIPVDAPTNNGQCLAQVPDTGPVDSALPDAAVADSSTDAAPLDAATDSNLPDTSVPQPPLDDAGGNLCGVPLNDAEIPNPNQPGASCKASSAVLVSGGGTVTSVTSVDDAGNTIDGGTQTTGGVQKVIPSKYLCGSGDFTQTSITVTGLKNGIAYTIAVAATDAVGNVGPLSTPACGTPAPIDDFWKDYWAAGGRAGGGFCSTDGAGVPAGTTGLGVLVLAAMASILRKRRRS